jgi:hypothetical protein
LSFVAAYRSPLTPGFIRAIDEGYQCWPGIQDDCHERAPYPRPQTRTRRERQSALCSSKRPFSLDSITLDTVIQSVASALLRTGDKAAAETTQKRIKTHGKRALAGTKAA